LEKFLAGCDHIIVMKDGRITEEGTHEELMEEEGEYSHLIHTFYNSESSELKEYKHYSSHLAY